MAIPPGQLQGIFNFSSRSAGAAGARACLPPAWAGTGPDFGRRGERRELAARPRLILPALTAGPRTRLAGCGRAALDARALSGAVTAGTTPRDCPLPEPDGREGVGPAGGSAAFSGCAALAGGGGVPSRPRLWPGVPIASARR